MIIQTLFIIWMKATTIAKVEKEKFPRKENFTYLHSK